MPLDDAPSSRLKRLKAALRLAGEGAVVTGREAMWLHGLPVQPQGAIHVLVPSRGPRRTDGSVTTERASKLPDSLWRKGFPTAPLARATVDACRRTPSHGEIRVLVLEAVHRGGVSLDSVHEELADASGAGTTLLRKVLSEIDRGIRFAGSRIACDIVARAGLPPPRWGVRLSTADDVHLASVDAWWDDVGMAWDAEVHRPWAPRTPASVSTRAARLIAYGVVTVHTTPNRTRDDADAVVEELRGAYLLASARPRPEVVAD